MVTIPATPTRLRVISGRYEGSGGEFDVRLRVDVDGPSPTQRVSADYIRRATGESGSMRVDAPQVLRGERQTTIIGAAVFSFPTKCRRVSVTIPHMLRDAPSPARLRHLTTGAGDGDDAFYDCEFTSPIFRVVDLEQACEQGIELPGEYDTAALPSRCPPRRLTLIEAFADAGIELRSPDPPTIIETTAAGDNATWSDAELQAAMQQYFTRLGDVPRWAVWLLHAASHDDQNLAGMMFDEVGLHRQGCAVFYGYSTDSGPERLRSQLHTAVHELGHAFNLPHCWQQSLTDPPLPGRPEALTWMNYPERVKGGAPIFWQEFGFGFDADELVHLRHAFEFDVVMGGAPFRGRAARRRPPDWDVDLVQDPGLKLTLGAPEELIENTPVTVKLELTATTREGRQVPTIIGPRPGNVGIAIRRPDGTEFMFQPLLYHCRGDETVTLRAGDQPVRDAAFIHYGRRGFAFKQPGRYHLRALFAQPDGRVVISNVTSIRIKAAATRVDRHIDDLIAADEKVGKLLSLMGSDAPALRDGDQRLRQIIKRYPEHPVAVSARLAQAANLSHGFKRVASDGTIDPREPRLQEAAALVADVVLPGPTPRSPGRVRMSPDVDPSVSGFFDSRLGEITRSAAKVADG